MAKRVKKGFRMELRDGRGLVVAQEHDGKLRMTESSASAYDAVDLTAAMCEQAGILDALEDVPEPWERVREALAQAWREARGCDVGPFPVRYGLSTDDPARVCARVAELLGIKSEVES